jgi:multiple antibiotic resistance protein
MILQASMNASIRQGRAASVRAMLPARAPAAATRISTQNKIIYADDSTGERALRPELALFVGTFTTLLAIINPLEALPVYLKLLHGKDAAEHRRVARRSCIYATLLCLAFLVFGAFFLRLFGVSLSMVRIAGGIILTRIGFELFGGTPSSGNAAITKGASPNIAFMPLAMPLMFGPGAIAVIIGMTSTVKHSPSEMLSFGAICVAILATMYVTYLCLAYADGLTRRLGATGIDALTRIVGFFVSAIGVDLIFNGIIQALEEHGIATLH